MSGPQGHTLPLLCKRHCCVWCCCARAVGAACSSDTTVDHDNSNYRYNYRHHSWSSVARASLESPKPAAQSLGSPKRAVSSKPTCHCIRYRHITPIKTSLLHIRGVRGFTQTPYSGRSQRCAMPRGMLPVLALTLWTLYRYAPGVLSYASNGPGSCVQQGFSCQVAVWPLQAGRELSVLTAPRELVALTSGYHQAAVTYLQSAVESLWQYTRVSTAAALKVAMPLASLGWNPGLMLAVLVVVSTAALLFTAGLTPAQSQVPAQRAYSRAPQVCTRGLCSAKQWLGFAGAMQQQYYKACSVLAYRRQPQASSKF